MEEIHSKKIVEQTIIKPDDESKTMVFQDAMLKNCAFENYFSKEKEHFNFSFDNCHLDAVRFNDVGTIATLKNTFLSYSRIEYLKQMKANWCHLSFVKAEGYDEPDVSDLDACSIQLSNFFKINFGTLRTCTVIHTSFENCSFKSLSECSFYDVYFYKCDFRGCKFDSVFMIFKDKENLLELKNHLMSVGATGCIETNFGVMDLS